MKAPARRATSIFTIVVAMLAIGLIGTAMLSPGFGQAVGDSLGVGAFGLQADELDHYIKREMENRQIPGLAFAVLREGRVIKMTAYGLASIELNVPATPKTVFDLASITKPFTATAIMLLVEEGKISLDEKINKYLPNAPVAWKGITVRHLLTHTAGLKDGFWPEFWGYPLIHYPTPRLFEAASEFPVDFGPGERWQYSDQGYFLLGMIIETVGGNRYEEFLRERVFGPLGMSATVVLGQDPWAIVENRASTYTVREGKLARFRVPYWTAELGSEGGLWSTLEDLAKWAAALYDETIFTKSSLDQMWTPVILNSGFGHGYGLGWYLRKHRGRRVIHHAGLSGTDFLHLPDDKLTVIVLTNIDARVSDPFGLAIGVAGRYLPDLLVSSLNEQPDPDPQMTQKLRTLLLDIANGESDLSLITPVRRARLSRRHRRIAAERVRDLKSFDFVACDEVEQHWTDRFGVGVNRICYYKLVNALETSYYWFYLTADGKVADFRSSKNYLLELEGLAGH